MPTSTPVRQLKITVGASSPFIVTLKVEAGDVLKETPGTGGGPWFRPTQAVAYFGRQGELQGVRVSGWERLPASNGRPPRDGKAWCNRWYYTDDLAGRRSDMIDQIIQAATAAHKKRRAGRRA